MRVGVIGGAGGMGSVTVRDLARSPGVEEVRIVDRDRGRAETLAAELGGSVVVGPVAERLADALLGCDGVVNAASHRLNVPAMEACLEAGAHYSDLGGLFHWALLQYELDERFREAGLAAAFSMGSAPGLTNMLAAACCDRLDTVEAIEIADAIIPGVVADPQAPYVPPYAASTIIDEFTVDAAAFLDGEMRMLPADSSPRVYAFPEAEVECVYTIHSEPATLSRSYAAKGVRRVEWRLGLPPLDVARMRAFIAAGLTSGEPIAVGEASVVPRDVLAEVLMRQARSVEAPDDPGACEWLRVIVSGTRAGAPVQLVAEMRVADDPRFGGVPFGAWFTGTPPSVAIQMLCRGERLRDGAGGPEAIVPVTPFFAEMAGRWLPATLIDGDEVLTLGA